MQNINAMGSNHGKHHAYAYGHARKEAAANFKELITSAEDKSTVAKDFKTLIAAAEIKPENNTSINTFDD